MFGGWEMRKTIELFSGTKSFSKVAESRGYSTFTVDNNRELNPDLTASILEVKPCDIPKDPFILWASPPCTAFSVASIGASWCANYHPKRVETALGMAYILKTLELINAIKPVYWFIENPVGVMRKMAFLEPYNRRTITYCQYGDTRMKPTDIWTNCAVWTPRPRCKNGDSCHESAPRGSRTGTQGLSGAKERGVIPPALFDDIFDIIESSEITTFHKEVLF